MGAGRESLRRLLAMVAALALAAAPSAWRLSDEDRRALDAVSADSLRGHLSFLASDALGGRVTPSAGQQVAAEYIAAQFRRAGLEPSDVTRIVLSGGTSRIPMVRRAVSEFFTRNVTTLDHPVVGRAVIAAVVLVGARRLEHMREGRAGVEVARIP